MAHQVTLIPGDGTGPEIMETVRRVIAATGVQILWELVEAGSDAMEKYGTPLPIEVLEMIHGSAPKYKGLNKVNPSAKIVKGGER